MDSTVTQLRIADGLVSAEGSGVHAANAGTGQRQPGGGGRRLVAENAEEPGPDERNVRVHRAVSDIDGATGMAILRAIVDGERDAGKLAKLRDRRCHKSEEEIAEQWSGHWREDHLFSLRQGLKMYDSIQERIVDYEKEILRKLGEMERTECRGQAVPPLNNPQKAKLIRKRGEEFMRQALYRMSGVDLTGKTPRERCSS